MRALLDVNVLIALLDRGHTYHRPALEWFVANAEAGWASCPLTENGCVRILSQTAYPNTVPIDVAEAHLRMFADNRAHDFWPDDISILDAQRFDLSRGLGARQLTDLYLLGLAVAHNGRLVTFDKRISRDAVRGAEPDNLIAI